MTDSLKNALRFWLPAIAWMGFVFLASSDALSAHRTGSVLYALLRALFGPIEPGPFHTIHYVVRKTAHLTVYGVLSFLWFRAWRGPAFTAIAWRMRWALRALGVCLVVAVLDEAHQHFVKSRNGSASDVVLDMCGAVLAQMVVFWVLRSQQEQLPKTAACVATPPGAANE